MCVRHRRESAALAAEEGLAREAAKREEKKKRIKENAGWSRRIARGRVHVPHYRRIAVFPLAVPHV